MTGHGALCTHALLTEPSPSTESIPDWKESEPRPPTTKASTFEQRNTAQLSFIHKISMHAPR